MDGGRLPLHNVRVVDFGQVIAIPFGTMWMASMGAEVVLIESQRNLTTRRMGPASGEQMGLNRSAGFNCLNRNKLSLSLNLATPQGLAITKEIITISDVVVDNFATGTMERLGLGYSELRKLRPDIIMTSLGAFGRSGPWKHFVGLHSAANAGSGLGAVTGYPGGHPRIMGSFLPDFYNGTWAALAVLQALFHRARTGRGQYIDEAMAEGMMTLIPEAMADYSLNGREPQRVGNRDNVKVPHGVYRCQGEDAWIAISVSSDEEWRALCHATGCPEWREDPRFAGPLERHRHQEELDGLITLWTRERTSREAMETLQGAGVPAGPCFTPKEILEDPHLRARDFIVPITHPEDGEHPTPGIPWKISTLPPARYRHAPLFGEHTACVLNELLGMPVEGNESLVAERVLY
ncbi:MAG: CoA transferase [Chloroflexi bacterium]|nr:CoA transferase [Chloroflexota bacterium]